MYIPQTCIWSSAQKLFPALENSADLCFPGNCTGWPPILGAVPYIAQNLYGHWPENFFQHWKTVLILCFPRTCTCSLPVFGCCPVYSPKPIYAHRPENSFQHWKTVLILCFPGTCTCWLPVLGCCPVYSPKPIWSLAQQSYPVVSQHWNKGLIQRFPEVI